MTAPVSASRPFGRVRASGPLAALDPAALKVDARTLPQMLAMAPEMARLLRYYDLADKVTGDWTAFFRNDILFLLAEIATCGEGQGSERSNRLDAELDRRGGPQAAGLHQQVADSIAELALCINDWYQRAQEIDLHRGAGERGELTVTLAKVIKDELGPLLVPLPGQSGRLEALDPLWKEESEKPALLPLPLTQAALLKILHQFTDAITRLGIVALAYLQQQLGKSDHAPHTSLYVAFVEVQAILQQDLNRFGERHLAYYYQQLLKLRPRPAQPDSAHVAFELPPGAASVTIPAGTLLKAGKDAAGDEVLFATCDQLDVNPVAIDSIRTLFVRRSEEQWVESICAASVDPAPAAAAWPTFGAALADKAGLPVELGFVIASPALLLTEGERDVTLNFLPASDSGFAALCDTFTTLVGQRFSAPDEQAPALVLRAGCRLYLSGAKGWVQVQDFSFGIAGTPPALSLGFRLDAAAPACVANPLLAPDPACLLPMLKLVLEDDAPLYLYSFFARLEVTAVDIAVEVKGIAGLDIASAAGPVAIGKPFPPFGALAQCGLGFQAGHPELQAKQVSVVALRLRWQDLLEGADTIAAHYKGYPMRFDDQVFQVGADVYDGAAWQTLAGGAPLPLFGAGYAQSSYRFDMPGLGQPGAAGRGAVRLTLVNPPYGFGQRQFPAIFADKAIANAAALMAKQPALPTINSPLSPMLAGVLLDYRASDVLSMEGPADGAQARCFYLSVFGYCRRPERLRKLMLADESAEGHLYIGLKAPQAPASLSLYFELRQPAVANQVAVAKDGEQKDPVSWRYLADNEWSALAASQVHSRTDGLSRSGVVELQLPAAINGANTVMKPGLFWIEAQVAGGAAAMCPTAAIMANTVRAERSTAAGGAALPAGSITGLLKKTVSLQALSQPFAGFGGRAAESAPEYRARVSRRLRHKQRASQPRDFEELILEQFPAVWQAKCCTANNTDINNSSYRDRQGVEAGKLVLVVAAPVRLHASVAVPALPLYLLREIAAGMRALGSPFIDTITVRNPLFEAVKVFVTVRFAPGQQNAATLKQLNQAISDRIAPWQAQEGLPIDIGCNTLHGHSLAEVIGRLPFIESVTGLMMRHTWFDGSMHAVAEDGFIAPTTPWSALAPVAQHGVTVDPPARGQGISAMVVGADFYLPSPAPMTMPMATVTPVASPGEKYFLLIDNPTRPRRGGAAR